MKNGNSLENLAAPLHEVPGSYRFRTRFDGMSRSESAASFQNKAQGALPRILVIDDDPISLTDLGVALHRVVSFEFAASGRQGIWLATESPPDLILLDATMSEIDCFEVFRQIKAQPGLQAVPLIFLIVRGEVDAESIALALGADDCIEMPVNVDLAKHRIAGALELQRLRQAVDQMEAGKGDQSSALHKLSQGWRDPMHNIISMLYMLNGHTSGPEQKRQLEIATQASQQLLAVIESALGVSGPRFGLLRQESTAQARPLSS